MCAPFMSKFTATLFMPERYWGLSYLLLKFSRRVLPLCLIVFSLTVNAQTTDELKKQAEKLFKDENYDEAYKFYSQLVSNFPKDPDYNYHLGVCMIYSEADKTKCLPYLKLAAANPNDAPKEVLFYLGKAYHINYRFDEAIRNYNEFKKTAASSLQKKLQVDREIRACTNGKKLLTNISDLSVLSKKELAKADYFRSYDLKKMGKLLVKPDEFKTSADKKKKDNSVVFLPSKSEIVYFSSFGDNTDNGKDIYMARRTGTGFTAPVKVASINTEFDEDYPFLHPDGKTLYFASKGFNSMGGYDIFRSTFNEATQTWGQPENLEFPINSPDDDFLFVTDSLETTAYFSTGRQSSPGKIDVLKIKTKRRPVDAVAIKGTVIASQVDHSLASIITVKDKTGKTEYGKFQANEQGEYVLEVPNDSKLMFTVETPGLETQTAEVVVPASEKLKPLKQSISYENGKLRIENVFDQPTTDDSYLDYLNVIEKKAKLNVNADENQTDSDSPLAAETKGTTASPEPSKNLSNKELAAMAKKDADESRQEALKLSADSKSAMDAGASLNSQSAKKKLDADKLREQNPSAADSLQKAAEEDASMATRILALGNALSDDARRKEKEADLNAQYAKELDKAVTSKDPKILQRLNALQQEIDAVSKEESRSAEMLEAIRVTINESEKSIVTANSGIQELQTSITEIKTNITGKEAELAEAKKKKEKERLTSEVDNLKLELGEKESELASLSQRTVSLQNELANAKNELNIANNLQQAAKAQVQQPIAVDMNAKQMRDYYGSKVLVEDNTDKNSVQASINSLNQYNLDLDAAIDRTKKSMAETKAPAQKQAYQAELKALETDKKLNQTRLSANFNKLTELNKQDKQDKVELEVSTTYSPIKADNPLEAMNVIRELEADIKEDNAELFGITYKSPEALKLRDEANQALQGTADKKTEVLGNIETAKENLTKVDTVNAKQIISTDTLFARADAFTERAQALHDEANRAVGAEKERLNLAAKNADNLALDAQIAASEQNSKDNTALIAANKENIQNLIKLNKASEADIATAKRLNDEAVTAFRKAVEIRAEGRSQVNKGSEVGAFSNADDLEAEAILKQEKAVTMLMLTAPDFQLKKASTSAVLAQEQSGKPNGLTLDQALADVNGGVVELGKLKLPAYQQLYAANAAELELLSNEVNAKEKIASQNPVLKTDLMRAKKLADYASQFKTSSDNAVNVNDQFNFLLTAIKQQNLAQQKYAELKFALDKAEQKANSPKVQTEIVGEQSPDLPVASTKPKIEDAKPVTKTTKEPVDEENTQITINQGNEGEQEQEPSQTEASVIPEKANNLVNVQSIAQEETSSSQIISELGAKSTALKNEEAGDLVKNSLARLKTLEGDYQKNAEALAANEAQGSSAVTADKDPETLRKEADAYLEESEDLADEAEEVRAQASKAKADKKPVLLAEAKELERQSQEKMLASAKAMQSAFEVQYLTNKQAIDELMGMLKTDDAGKADEFQGRIAEYEAILQKSKQLRKESEQQSTLPAKLGTIGNAEEKEAEVLQKQSNVLAQLRSLYPNYEVKPYSAPAVAVDSAALQKQKTIVEEQYTQMINLTNGYNLEYESSKVGVPENLSEEDMALKQNADELNAESKRLLIASALEPDYSRRMRLLALAAKYGNTALEQLNAVGKPKNILASTANKNTKNVDFSKVQIIDGSKGDDSDVKVTGGNIKSDIKPTVNSKTPKQTKPAVASANMSSKLGGITITKGNAYSNANPIPIDAPMEKGLVFRVQIGAFKSPIPNNSFKGLSPLNGETTRNGYIRYTAGNFQKIEGASAVKNDLRSLGYNDAFVVVYLDGKRITIADALAKMAEQGIAVDPNASQTAGITANANVPKATQSAEVIEPVAVNKQLEKTQKLLYTIQVGVFNKQASKAQLRGLSPVNTEQISNGLYRYTAGIYNNPERVLGDKAKVVDLGFKDAFVSAYLNGKRVNFADAKAKQEADNTIETENEVPISLPNGGTPEYVTTTAPAVENSTVVPYKNSVTSYPEANEENGVKADENGVAYKIQLGAFNGSVPEDMVALFNQIKDWPVDYKMINGMYVYTVGNFVSVEAAKELRDEIRALGLSDSYITVYKNGRKLGGQEAEDLLKQN